MRCECIHRYALDEVSAELLAFWMLSYLSYSNSCSKEAAHRGLYSQSEEELSTVSLTHSAHHGVTRSGWERLQALSVLLC